MPRLKDSAAVEAPLMAQLARKAKAAVLEAYATRLIRDSGESQGRLTQQKRISPVLLAGIKRDQLQLVFL